MGKGILLELHGRNAVVMTSQGEFKRVSVLAGAWEVGDEVDFTETRAVPWVRWGLAAAAAAVMMLAPVGYQSWALAQPVAVVTVDINPSLRLTLNKNEQVLSAEGLNADGVTLLASVEWRRRAFGQVVAEITARAVEAGKLDLSDESSAMVVAVTSAKPQELSDKQSDSIAADARTAIAAEMQHQGKARNVTPRTNVPVLQATTKEKAEADAQGLTPGQYLLWQEVQQTLPDVKPDELKQMGPGKFLKSLPVNPGTIFDQVEEHHGSKGRDGGKTGNADGNNDVRPATSKPGVAPPVKANPGQPAGGTQIKPGDNGKSDGKANGDDRNKQDDRQNGKKSSGNDGLNLPVLPGIIQQLQDDPRAGGSGDGAPKKADDKSRDDKSSDDGSQNRGGDDRRGDDRGGGKGRGKGGG